MSKNVSIVRLHLGKQPEQGKQRLCPLCQKASKPEDFRDELSKREHKISGMCQKCQDRIFE